MNWYDFLVNHHDAAYLGAKRKEKKDVTFLKF